MSIDKRLTATEKKKIKPVNQGGGPNYLGKQETVTVPKKWLSDPDHVVAELAYITPREQKILLDANIYGSLKGKPNKGPGGIMSLQGDLGGYDASPGGPNDSGSKGSSTESKSKQLAADIMTGKTNVSSPTGVTEGYTGPEPVGRNTAGDFVGPGYKNKVGGFDDKGIFSTSFAPTKKPGFGILDLGLMLATGGLFGAKAKTLAQAYGTMNRTKNLVGDLSNTFGFESPIANMFSGNTKSKSTSTSENNTNNDGGNGGGGEDGIATLKNQAGGYDEYVLLLQKLQSGNISDSEQNRYNVLKNMLGI